MYVSPAVRSIRDDPIEGESVTLLLETDADTDPGAVADAVEALDCTVEEELQFETLRVTVPHERVGDVCAVDGIATVETDGTLAIDAGGAGEDV
ncbi:MAG: hypothetical protein ABEJ40_02240 [Haloarculaceae archaeon]